MKNLRLFIVLLALSGCGEFELNSMNDESDMLSVPIAGTWKMVQIEKTATGEIFRPDSSTSWNMDVIITFNENEIPHKLTGQNTSNFIAGTWSYGGTGEIHFNGLSSTKAAQPKWGNMFLELIHNAKHDFEVENGHLMLINPDSGLSGKFVRP